MNELQAKAIQAATRFCERRGYEILATQWEGPDGQTADIVADDEGTICFIDVTATDHSEGGFADGHTERAAWELAAASWLAEHSPEGGHQRPLRPLRHDRRQQRQGPAPLPRQRPL